MTIRLPFELLVNVGAVLFVLDVAKIRFATPYPDVVNEVACVLAVAIVPVPPFAEPSHKLRMFVPLPVVKVVALVVVLVSAATVVAITCVPINWRLISTIRVDVEDAAQPNK